MSERFYSSQPISSENAMLDGPEAHHLLHVMRAHVGERVTLFDGSGAEFDALIEKLSRATVELRVLERREVDRELPFSLIVGVALPKGDRQKWLVEKLTELGVTELVPLITERGVAQPTAGAIERLQRTVIEACKQCGRNRLLRISKPRNWGDWLETVLADQDDNRLLAHPRGRPMVSMPVAGNRPTRIAIGPEGGFTDDEVAAATAAGWQTVDLGTRILRVETAAVALTSAVTLQSASSTYTLN
jgi:16S rRNA (uracil1498-N3)-methyltransferase